MLEFLRKYKAKFLSLYSKNLIFAKRYSSKGLTLQGNSIMFWYYNESINWGDTSNFICNFENNYICWDKILKNSIQNNFSKSQKFSRQMSLMKFRSSQSFVFTVCRNFTYNPETYNFAKLYTGVFRTQSNI